MFALGVLVYLLIGVIVVVLALEFDDDDVMGLALENATLAGVIFWPIGLLVYTIRLVNKLVRKAVAFLRKIVAWCKKSPVDKEWPDIHNVGNEEDK